MKSWKTTLLGILTILATLSSAGIDYLAHGTMPDFSKLLPGLIAGWGLIVAKDHNVTTAPAVKSAPYLPIFAALMIPVMLLGCSTVPTGNALIDRRNRVANAMLAIAEKDLGKVSVSILREVVSQYQGTGTIDYVDAASKGAWASAEDVADAGDFKLLIDAWTGNQAPAVTAAATTQFQAALDAGVSARKAANAIAYTLSAAAVQNAQ